ncbi:MAG TPA: IPTL-CTERM sorting domain-containing protein, partial [Thermoanaerobaculia bacterium]
VDTPLASPCGAGSTLTGTGVLVLSGGSLAPGASCSFEVTLAVPADAPPGSHPNVTSPLTDAGVEVAPPAGADLVVQPLPAIGKAFAPDEVEVGGTTTVSIVLDNTASSLPATGVSFTDTLPAGMTVADPPNAATDCTGGTLTAVAGATSVGYSGGTVPAGAVCAVVFDVRVAASGDVVNTVEVTTSLGTTAPAAAELVVVAGPSVLEIPTASEWGLFLLAALLAAGGLWRLRP